MHPGYFSEAQRLPLPGGGDALVKLPRRVAIGGVTKLLCRRRRHLDAQIDAIENRPGDLRAIAIDITGRALARSLRMS
jgi:hypothetical protein